ncbi:unnamed protein product [Phytophthora lilii]|uniref:Unnamed protein product n=1 Tax=Phytophthora lilii TaxID=2077276 RepID=A0A9W6WN64_9STRA|nr:unnamed protein product [Phytophthora lilii]
MMNPDIWSPYYPHVVMLPSGLVQVHPGPGSEARGATEMWCGYNRFPLINFGGNAGNGALGEQQRTTGYGTAGIMPSGPRVLPPTWEEPRSGSPFLPPYPVTILGRDEAEDKRLTAPMSPSERLEERVHTPPIEASRSSFQLPSGEFRRVQGSMDWSMVTRGASSSAANTTGSDCKQPGECLKLLPVCSYTLVIHSPACSAS